MRYKICSNYRICYLFYNCQEAQIRHDARKQSNYGLFQKSIVEHIEIFSKNFRAKHIRIKIEKVGLNFDRNSHLKHNTMKI